MAKFLTTSGISYQIENIIMGANEFLTLVSPYLQISITLQERLKDAAKKGVQINIIYGKDELNETQKYSLSAFKNLSLYFSKNLHAKCYYNEKEMVITSMNMYEFSEKNNREMGILIDALADKDIYDNAANETNSIITHSNEKLLKVASSVKTDTFNLAPMIGYCIRCASEITYEPERPYCLDCFTSWVTLQNNIYFNEKVCYCCGGNNNPVSMNNPQCKICRGLYRQRKTPLKA